MVVLPIVVIGLRFAQRNVWVLNWSSILFGLELSPNLPNGTQAQPMPTLHRNTSVCINWVPRQFSENKTAARQQYRQFEVEGLKDKQERFWEKLIGQIFLGSGRFVAMMEEHIEGKREIAEIPRYQRFPGRPSLDRIFAGIANASRQRRKLLIAESHIKYGYTLKEIADFLGIHYTTVSKIVATIRK